MPEEKPPKSIVSSLLEEDLEEDVYSPPPVPREKKKKRKISDHWQISIPIQDKEGNLIGDRGLDIEDASPDDMTKWVKHICPYWPTKQIDLIKETLEKNQGDPKSYRRLIETLFNNIVEAHTKMNSRISAKL